MHLALRNIHSSPPDFLFGSPNSGLVGPPPLQVQSRSDRTRLSSFLPLRTPLSSRAADHPASRPLTNRNSPPSMDSTRTGQGLDQDSVARENSAINNDPSSGSEQRQGSAEAGPSTLASAPGYAQPRRRASRAGTRSVTTLSATQLERKRANDREAQRAIRARTKEHIEKLERRLHELTSQGGQSEQLIASMKRQRELEEENQDLRSRLQQAHYSLGMPADSPDAAWASNASILRTPISNAGLPIMSQPQLQTNVPPPTRQDSTGSHLAGWQDSAASFGSPTSIRRGGPSPTAYHSDLSSLASGSTARRDTMSPVGPVGGAGASNSIPAGVEYTYRPVVGGQQYGSIQDSVPHQAQHPMSGDSRMAAIHTGPSAMTNYAPHVQQHPPAPAPAASSVQHPHVQHQHQQPQQPQQQQQHSHHSHSQSQPQQSPQYMPYHASPTHPTAQAQPGAQSQSQIGPSGFTAQNAQHHSHPHQSQQTPRRQNTQEQQQQQQQQQQPLYYGASSYGH